MKKKQSKCAVWFARVSCINVNLHNSIYTSNLAYCFQVLPESKVNFNWLFWITILFNSRKNNALKWQRGKECFTLKLFLEKPQCSLTLMLTGTKFYLKLFSLSLKNPFCSGMRAPTLNTRAFEKMKQKVPNIYTLTPFPCNWLCTILGAIHECQLPWVTEANLTLHSL